MTGCRAARARAPGQRGVAGVLGSAGVLGVLAGLGVLGGCSQTRALGPVSSREVLVRFAAIDALVDRGTTLGVAPVCTTSDRAVSCRGITADGQAVVASSPAPTPPDPSGSVRVTVGSAVVYDGSVADLLDRHAEPTGGATS